MEEQDVLANYIELLSADLAALNPIVKESEEFKLALANTKQKLVANSDDEDACYEILDDFAQRLPILAQNFWANYHVAKQNTKPENYIDTANLTEETVTLIRNTIAGVSGFDELVSADKKVIFEKSFRDDFSAISFKTVAVDRLTDFIEKFLEPDSWNKYFVGNIGKNNKNIIQDYHPMDTYNKKHNTLYSALHLGNTRRCVILTTNATTDDGTGEFSELTFENIGAHTLIDKFDEQFSVLNATPEQLAELFNLNS